MRQNRRKDKVWFSGAVQASGGAMPARSLHCAGCIHATAAHAQQLSNAPERSAISGDRGWRVFFMSIICMQEIEGQVQSMKLPEKVENAWKDADKHLSENPVSKGVESLQHMVDPSVSIRHYCRLSASPKACAVCHQAYVSKHAGTRQSVNRYSGLNDAELGLRLPEGQPATGGCQSVRLILVALQSPLASPAYTYVDARQC